MKIEWPDEHMHCGRILIGLLTLLLASLTFFASGIIARVDAAEVMPLVEPQVVRFGPGVHRVGRIHLTSPHAVLEGAGRGVTILVAPEGVVCDAANPIVRDLTLVGDGSGIGLLLQNTWSAQVQNVSIESYALGVRLELNDGGGNKGDRTLRRWPTALSSGHWGSRVTLTEFREVHITGDGDGLVFSNTLPSGNKGAAGEFFTATTLWGGHVAVQGTAILIGDHVWNTKVIGTYIDVGFGGGIIMDPASWDLTLIGVSLDVNSAARESGAHKVTAGSQRALKSITAVATTLASDEILLCKDSARHQFARKGVQRCRW